MQLLTLSNMDMVRSLLPMYENRAAGVLLLLSTISEEQQQGQQQQQHRCCTCGSIIYHTQWRATAANHQQFCGTRGSIHIYICTTQPQIFWPVAAV